MTNRLILTALLFWGSALAHGAAYSNLSIPQCDEANSVIYDGKGFFAVQSAAESTVDLSISLPSLLSYANSNDYKSGAPLLLWNTDLVDYGLTDVADTGTTTGSRIPALTGLWAGKIWPNAGKIEYATLQKYATPEGKVTLRVSNSCTEGVTVSAVAADGSTHLLYRATGLKAAGTKSLSGYRINLNYATALSLHTPSTLDTSTYTAPPDYTAPFTSRRADGTSLGRVMFLGDSITHGVNDQTWRWQLFKILVDNGIEAEIVGPRSGYTPGYTRLTTKDAGDAYGGVSFPNVHLAQSSGRTHNIITGSNAGMSGVNYGGHSTSSSADTYNCNTWCCLMGTNDLLSDSGYSPAEFAAKMQRMLGGRVSARGNRFSWAPGSTWGNLGKLAEDILRDKDDELYVMSVPCWGRHHNNNAAERHETVQKYNGLLKKWVETYRQKSGLKLHYVEINKGLVDPMADTPFTWPDSMSNRPGSDGLHPNEQGSLIIAGNLARALQLAGRTAGLPRASASTWNRTRATTIKPGNRLSYADGELRAADGYSFEITTEYSKSAVLNISLDDGTNSGTLSIGNGRICWGDTPLYCDKSMQEIAQAVRIVWHKGDSTRNVLPGYYVWVGDMLIGQGLAPSATSGARGITLSVNRGSAAIKSARWVPGAYAPATTGKSSQENSFNIK